MGLTSGKFLKYRWNVKVNTSLYRPISVKQNDEWLLDTIRYTDF